MNYEIYVLAHLLKVFCDCVGGIITMAAMRSYTAHICFTEKFMRVYIAHALVYTLTSCVPSGTCFTIKLIVNLDSRDLNT